MKRNIKFVENLNYFNFNRMITKPSWVTQLFLMYRLAGIE